MQREEVVLVAGAGEVRSITAEYDPSCKLVQFVKWGEEVFGTLEPIEPQEWQEITDRLGRAAPFMLRVLTLVQEVERVADLLAKHTPAGARELADELRGATKRFAGAIEPEEVVEVAHAADGTFTLTAAEVKLLTGDLSDHDGDADLGMKAVLALDTRFREFLGKPIDEIEERSDV